jgi:dipeptidyl aminopeptidase/acylaminoacyl peptidase
MKFAMILCGILLSGLAHAGVIQDHLQSSLDSKKIEYFWMKPEGVGPFPFILLIHPEQDSPKTGGKLFVDSGQLEYWTKKGFVTVAISQPGYGDSEGPADFCGHKTQRAALDVIQFFRKKSDLVSSHMFVYGGSRGAVVASMVAAQDSQLSGVILKSGVYDFVQWSKSRPWYDMIRLTMIWETGWLSEDKLRERSAIFLADKIKSPVLIIHGVQDDRAPLELAEQFSNAINKSGGHAELAKIESGHVIPMPQIDDLMASFMKEK